MRTATKIVGMLVLMGTFGYAAAMGVSSLVHGSANPNAGATYHVTVYSGGCEVARYRALGSSLAVSDGLILFTETAHGRRIRLTGTVVVEEVKQP